VREIINRQKSDKKYRYVMNLTSKKADALNLNDMRKLLTCVRENRPQVIRSDVKPIQEVIDDLPISMKDKVFLTSEKFTSFLSNLYGYLRPDPEHSATVPNVMDEITKLRVQALGIGCHGYLVYLARIKKRIHDAWEK